MVRGRKWRRKIRALMRHRQRKTKTAAQGSRRAAQQAFTPRQRKYLLQTTVCGGLFVLLIALKLLLPGNLADFRATLSHWLVRDADFAAAFSAVGRAVGGTQEFATSLGEAYTAVFGYEEATAVFGNTSEEKEIVDLPRDNPEGVIAEKLTLGFACSSPLLGEVTSSFGWREDPNSGADAFHYGIDIAAEQGSDIACFADGIVGVVGESAIWGNYLTVQHEGDIATLYAHCDSVFAQSGQKVSMGETIAVVGSTGNATGPHLHFELRKDTAYLNPMHYVAD